jgi:hypothetical protein
MEESVLCEVSRRFSQSCEKGEHGVSRSEHFLGMPLYPQNKGVSSDLYALGNAVRCGSRDQYVLSGNSNGLVVETIDEEGCAEKTSDEGSLQGGNTVGGDETEGFLGMLERWFRP